MNFQQLLFHRQALLRQARLANLAYTCQQLTSFADRVARAGLTGEVRLHETDSEAEGYGASLTALQGSQAVIEEHFTDEDLLDLAELVAYATDCEEVDLTFRIEELADVFVHPLRRELAQAGVALDAGPAVPGPQPEQNPLNQDSGG
jgi:hypothetical protein